MAKAILMDEIHVTVFAPHGLPEAEYKAMHKTLKDRHFVEQLRRAAREIVGRHPSLSKTTVKVSR